MVNTLKIEPKFQESIQPGICDISNDAYHQGPGISRSALMEFRKSPYHYWYKYLNPDYKPKPETPYMDSLIIARYKNEVAK